MGKREEQWVAREGNVCTWRRAFAAAVALAVCLIQPQPVRAQDPGVASNQAPNRPASQTAATHARVAATPSSTIFSLDLTASIAAEVYTLATPYRVVIDLPEATASLTAGTTATGLVKSYRTEPLDARGARIVIETFGPVEIVGVDWIAAARLQLTLKPMDKPAFGAGTGGDLAQPPAFALPPALALKPSPPDPPPVKTTPQSALVQQRAKSTLAKSTLAESTLSESTLAESTLTKAAVKPAVFDDAIAEDAPRAKPVVMIDPGHGGIDPGAIGRDKVTEKTIVLAVANQTKAALELTGRYDVRLTRTTDVFVPLDSRVALSKQAKADIFISLHADTIEDRQMARSVRGASVYTLSDKASNEDARLMAEKENAADLIAGITPRQGDAGDDIKPILFDLMARETATFSRLLSRSVITWLRKNHPMAHEPERAAAFRVLRQPHAPSVLIELGFLSNPDEEHLMTQTAWQKQVGAAIANAVDTYFTKKGSSMATAPLDDGFGGLPP